MKRIALLFTGGTVGARVKDAAADTAGESNRLLVRRFHQAHPGSRATFESFEPLSVLSENMTPEMWNRLLDALRGLDWEVLDGVVIMHGTDTLAFTAQLLAVLLAGISRPVFLVSSHTPPDDPAANGHRHFAAAVDWIEKGKPAGVFVPMENGGASEMARAQSLTQCAALTDRFGTVPCRPAKTPAEGPLLFRLPPLSARVVLVRPYPGLDYRSVVLPQGTLAVLHELYHSGTACVGGEHTGLSFLAARCRAAGAPLFVGPLPEGAAYEYASTRAMRAMGIHPLPGIPTERGYALLSVACALCASAQELPGIVDTLV